MLKLFISEMGGVKLASSFYLGDFQNSSEIKQWLLEQFQQPNFVFVTAIEFEEFYRFIVGSGGHDVCVCETDRKE